MTNLSPSPTNKDRTKDIQDAIDKIVFVDKNTGLPNSGAVTHQATRPNGGTVHLTAGLYRISKPIRLYGMVNLVGDGRSTFIEAEGNAIDLTGVELGGPGSGFANVWSSVSDLAIHCKGHAITCSTGGLVTTRIERVQVSSGGWMVYLPGPGTYSQDSIIRENHQINPGSGSILLSGNQNLVELNYVSNGTTAPYRSPWETDKLAIIDISGTNNAVRRNHVEFNVGAKEDGSPNAVVLSYAYRTGSCDVEGNWHELWPWRSFGDLGFSTLVDKCLVRGDMLEAIGGVVKRIT